MRGSIWWISELYVVDGLFVAHTTDRGRRHGRKRKWPSRSVRRVPAWQRVDFYLKRGFEEVGPRLQLTLDRSEITSIKLLHNQGAFSDRRATQL